MRKIDEIDVRMYNLFDKWMDLRIHQVEHKYHLDKEVDYDSECENK